jgi:hypothetical protein
MKLSAALLLLAPSTLAFSPSAFVRKTTTSALCVGSDPNVILGGNEWKPDSGKMGSTDTGDYFPDDYNPDEQVAFTEGMMGSQAMLGGDKGGPQLPGMENLVRPGNKHCRSVEMYANFPISRSLHRARTLL